VEEDVLLDMYRKSWNAFLEAYKTKSNQVEALSALISVMREKLPTQKAKKEIDKQLEIIKEM